VKRIHVRAKALVPIAHGFEWLLLQLSPVSFQFSHALLPCRIEVVCHVLINFSLVSITKENPRCQYTTTTLFRW
jgi:hypothetical protein